MISPPLQFLFFGMGARLIYSLFSCERSSSIVRVIRSPLVFCSLYGEIGKYDSEGSE
jgi:hypothetical protein